jgi:hypothetical protein
MVNGASCIRRSEFRTLTATSDRLTRVELIAAAIIELSNPDLRAACFDDPKLPAKVPASNGLAQACIVDKIEQFAGELSDPSIGSDERLFALKFLLHLVGDVYQPWIASCPPNTRSSPAARPMVDPPDSTARAGRPERWVCAPTSAVRPHASWIQTSDALPMAAQGRALPPAPDFQSARSGRTAVAKLDTPLNRVRQLDGGVGAVSRRHRARPA